MPVLARQLFEDDAAGTGLLTGAIGCGALLAALTLSMITPKRMLRTIVVTTAIFGVCLAVAGRVTNLTTVTALLVVCGAGMVMSLALCNMLIQQRTPDAMRGRVMSMYTLSFFAFVPFGNLVAGTLAEQRGIGVTLVTLGCALVVTAIGVAGGGWRLRRG